MSRPVISHRATLWALALLLVLQGSCAAPVQLGPVYDALREQKDQNRRLFEMFLSLRREQEELVKQVGCPNPAIREFMRACATHANYECAPQDVENTLKVMASAEHVLSYVKPETSLLHVERVGSIKNLLRTHARMSTTRLLVIAMAPGPSAADTVRAEEVARTVRDNIVKKLYPAVHPNESALPALPPLLLGCNQREEILRRYRLISHDRQLPGEPGEKERRILLWTFIVNC